MGKSNPSHFFCFALSLFVQLLSLFILHLVIQRLKGESEDLFYSCPDIFLIPSGRAETAKEHSPSLSTSIIAIDESTHHHRAATMAKDEITYDKQGRMSQEDEQMWTKPSSSPQSTPQKVSQESSRVESSNRIESIESRLRSPIAFSIAGLIHSFEDSLIVHELDEATCAGR